ncbi:tetratricopeptide repeat protein [Algibacillus agarilyticus]|uniref:tetratricopeptide repeat protein n=1 Tax=Algibacillus agarilyticus TaxID=2234133 RepID=UPI000DCF72C0|nr:tetratricopeptide repeat protein [Algibacillus agarilyticus]
MSSIINLSPNLLFVVLTFSFLTSCVLTKPNKTEAFKQQINARKTLADLNFEPDLKPVSLRDMTPTQKNEKLGHIYQQILQLEPDPNVRAKVEYRLVQLNIQNYEQIEIEDSSSDQALAQLITEYQDLLERYPEREDNEFIQYQLAKALDLQGRTDESLKEIETLLSEFPDTQYRSELYFRRGDIYYNLQDYTAALDAYNAVLTTDEQDKYRLNSLYMAGWAHFKMNELAQADLMFIKVIDALVQANEQLNKHEYFDFTWLSGAAASMANDALRVLSISLSQQNQSATLLTLIKQHESKMLSKYQHILFDNLAQFLIKKDLKLDAELTYEDYIDLNTHSIWAARFNLKLMDLWLKRGDFPSVRELKENYVLTYGHESDFWLSSSETTKVELLPHLLSFSLAHARSLYVKAQAIPNKQDLLAERQTQFSLSATWLKRYLDLARLPIANDKLTSPFINELYLYADASFEAGAYYQALSTYEEVAYKHALLPVYTQSVDVDVKVSHETKSRDYWILEAGYATTLTTREIIKSLDTNSTLYDQMIMARDRFDSLFVENFSDDIRALDIATQAAQYAFKRDDFKLVFHYSDFVLQTLNADIDINNKPLLKPDLSHKASNQVEVVTQLIANSYYTQEQYAKAETAYQLALVYLPANKEKAKIKELEELIASCIYLQADELANTEPMLAVDHFLRLGLVIPTSTYRSTAEFDAANLLLKHEMWSRAIDVLVDFQQRYPKHEYTASIPAKLAMTYEKTNQWDLAAKQLLVMIESETDEDLKREAQYTAAEYYLKAGDNHKALLAFRTYSHAYPEPFDVAQEVRLKMSEFYKVSKEPNKQYFWYRKIIAEHKRSAKKQNETVQIRSAYLASFAGYELGQAHHRTFKWTKLKAPLNKTLKRKQKAMKEAINYYQTVLNLALAEFVPKATYHLAEMYRQLAVDVMKSEKPEGLDELALEEYDILLEELAYPFEEKSIEIHTRNAQSAWQDVYDEWVKLSFAALAKIEPAHYAKHERGQDVVTFMH